ncbi:MAG TPA: ABC transporter permease [Solirubrobacterales bacterium]|nr:ABC transporter permease [Solirubrobacterales bacterium]
MSRGAVLRGALGILAFLALWELGARIDAPVVGVLPGPAEVASSFADLVGSGGYWSSWVASGERVLWGFAAAMAVGVPFGLLLAINQRAKALLFPPFEILRPIPPLAWVPLSILFWPTQNLSIEFVIFMGAFYTVVLNVVGGAEQIDRRHVLVARSLGAGTWTVYRRVILPATLPSIATGAVVGMGITWEVVVAAELISGGGGSGGDGGGLGFLLWNAYQGGAIAQVIVCMISLGVAGYASSVAVRVLSERLMPWKEAR